MTAWRKEWTWALLPAVLVSGCRATQMPTDTGARHAVTAYFEALRRQDWAGAYAALDPETQAHCSAEQFAQHAAKYRRGLGFEPENVRIRYCEERGTEATAQVIFHGRVGLNRRTYKDGITLRRTEAGWGVVLPSNFARG